MRKRIIIGLLAVVVIGVVVLTGRPNENSIVYHIKGYRGAERRINGYETFGDHIRETWDDVRGQSRLPSQDIDDKAEHERELIRLGYLEERTFVISNGTPSNVWGAVYRAMLSRSTNREFLRVSVSGTNGVNVVTVRSNMPTDEVVVRELGSAVQKNK